MTNSLLYRRIRKSEQSLLATLCKEDLLWTRYYISHGKWLSKALKDILSSEDRVAIGAFEPHIAEGNYSNKLVGCIFLKKSEFENTIELKNLILPQKETKEEEDLIAKTLIEKAIRFCEIRNIDKTEIELPQDEHRLISAFLMSNFRIVAIRERFNPKTLVCILQKHIGDIYFGDPFDNYELAKWLLKQYLPCVIVETKTNKGIVKISFEGHTTSKAFSQDNEIGNSKRLKGLMWILEHPEKGGIENDLHYIIENSKKSVLKLLLVDYLSSEEKIKLEENNFVYITNQNAKVIAGGKLSSMNTPIKADDIGGVVTVLEYDKILELSKRKTTTYYLFSGIQAGLEIEDYSEDEIDDDDDEDDDENYEDNDNEIDEEDLEDNEKILAVYCPNWKAKNDPGIIGFFRITYLEKESFGKLLKQPVPADSALTKEDLKFYRLFSEEDTVAVLKCSELLLFDSPLKIENGEWISDKKVEEYLNNQIYNNGNNAAYLDLDSCNKLKKIGQEENKSNIKNTIMIFESIAAAIGIIADTTTISDYAKKNLEKWKANLRNDEPASEKKITESNISLIIEAENEALNAEVRKFTNIKRNKTASDFDKEEYSKRIANRVLSILKTLETFKTEIKDYDALINYFSGVIKE